MRLSIAPFAFAFALVAAAQLPAAAQVAKVSPLNHDFGDMKQQQTVTTTVTITNEGAGLLEIRDVHADCGCTVPSLSKRSLAPTESTDITIEFNSKKFNGKIIKAVHVETNDPLNPLIDIMITANVHTSLVISPASQRLGFAQSLIGEEVSQQAIFTATGDTPLEISANATRKGLFHIRVINNLDGNPKMAAVEITVPSDMKPGQQRDQVRVTTNLPEFPSVDLDMKAWVMQEVNASPARLDYRFKNNLQQSIRISPFRAGTNFKVTGVQCDLPELKIEVMEAIPNQETKILIQGKPIRSDSERAIAANGRISGTITVHTDLKATPIIEIPVSYMVRM